MNVSDLIGCAEELQLPCFHLVEASRGDPIVGYWGGRRVDVPEEYPPEVTALASQRHLLSIDHSLFEQLGRQTRHHFALTVVTTVQGDERATAAPLQGGSLHGVSFKDAIPLTARPAKSFPCFQAVCLYGGEKVERSLRERGLQRWEYDSVRPDDYGAFQEIWRERCPLFATQIVAQVGGWHVRWPDDDFYIPREMELLLWTFRDAEPWYEVFSSPLRNLVMKERIT